MGGRKRVRSDKTDMSTFWQVIWTFVPHQVPVEGEVANREGSQIGDLPLPIMKRWKERACMELHFVTSSKSWV